MKKFLQISFVVLSLLSQSVRAGDDAVLTVTATQLSNGYDCDNDAWGICCGCFISICNYPDPRWRFRAGHSGANFSAWAYWNGGERTCGVWDIGDHNFFTSNVGAATTINLDAETWEEDGFGVCGTNENQYDPDNTCGFGWDGDDVHWGPGRLANFNFRGTDPCVPYDWGWFYTRNGYGVRIQTYYEWVNPPTWAVSPTANGSTFTVCPGIPLSFTSSVNTSDGQDVGFYFQWQTWNGSAWVNIGGATTSNYSFTAANSGSTTITQLYRLRVTSSCTGSFSSNVLTSSTITVNILPPASCFGSSCNTYFVDPVNGNDNNVSGPNTPWKTLWKALSVIGNNNTTAYTIKIARGTTVEPSAFPIIMQSNVTVEGGYITGASNTDWRKSSDPADKTIIGANYNWAAGSGRVGIIAGITAAGAANTCNNWRLQDLTIAVPTSGTSGYSTYGVYISGSSGYDITRCDISSAAAATSGAGSYGLYLTGVGAGTITDSKLAATSGPGVEYAIGQASGTAPTQSPAVFTVNSTVSAGTVNNPTNTTLLSGTVRTNSAGKYCINSEIDMTKAAGSWGSFPQTTSGVGSLNIVEDLKSGSSSYSTSSSPIKVYTTAGGAYNLTVNSGTMSKFLTVAPSSEYNRTVPVIAVSPSSVCVGGTGVALSITSGSYDATNILDREWLIYTDAQGPSSPAFSITGPGNTAPVVGPFTTAGTYNVRYRERHNCCGWSKPSFTTITVVADPTAPTVTRDPNLPGVCQGTSVRSNITFPSDGLSCSNTLEYSIDNGAWTSYTNNTYIGSTATSTIRIRGYRSCTGNGCTPVVFTEQMWTVEDQPIVFMQPQPVTACNGGTASMNTSAVGGIGLQYQWQSNTTSCASSFTDDGSPSSLGVRALNTSTNGVTYFQVVITSTAGSGCNTLTTNCATATVIDQASSGPVTKTPNTASVCTGTSVSASFSSGSNGVGCSDIQQYRFDGAGSWTTYAGSISTTGHTLVEVRNYRGMCDTTVGCSDATPNVVSWNVVQPPTSGTLSKSPNVSTVCHGTVVSASLATPGTNGVGCSDIIEYRSRSAGVWSSWTAGTSLATTSGMSDVEFRTYRGACDALSGCTDASPNTVSYVVTGQPVFTDPAVNNSGRICIGGSVTLSSTLSGGANNNTPRWEYYNGSSWVKVSNGTPTGVTYSDTTGNITLSGFPTQGDYQFRYYLPVNNLNCSAISDTVKVTVLQPFDPGAIENGGETICNGGGAPNTIDVTSPASGASGSFAYQWYQNITASPTCPAVGTPVGSLSGWTAVNTGSGYTGTIYSPPAGLTTTTTYLLAVDPTGTPDCGGFVTASQCYTITVYPLVTKGSLTGIDSICGSSGDASLFGFTATTGCVAPAGGTGNFQYQWYYYNTAGSNTAPAAGTTSTAGWTLIPGATAANYDPPAGYAPLNLAVGSGRSFACQVDATGPPDCDGNNNYQWSTGNFYVKISAQVGAGSIGPTPSDICNDDPSTINQLTATQGPAGSTYKYRWYYRTSTPNNNVGNGATANSIIFNNQSWSAVTPAATGTTYDPPSTLWGTGDTLILLRVDTIITQCNIKTPRWTNWVKVIRFSDNTPINTLSTINANQTRTLNTSKWYHFWNSNCELIASVNPNGQNLGSVTMAVNVDSVYRTFGNGGYGREQSCLNKPELAMGRYYTMTTQNTPGAGTTLVRLYYNLNDYNNYVNAILGLPYVNSYQICYGFPINESNLAVSRNALTDMTITVTSGLPTSPQIVIKEFALTPSLLRIGSPEGTTAGPTNYYFHTDGGIGEPLPVELVSFVGWNEGAHNQLQWVTASEENTEKFIVERSMTGAGDWSYIGEVAAAGNSNAPLTYQLPDQSPLFGNNYYRLKIIDLDGQYEYSNVINVPVNTVTRNAIMRVYPNPTAGWLNLDVQAMENFQTEIKVYDILGQVVSSEIFTLVRGMNTLKFNFTGLASASYIMTFNDQDGTQYQVKFVKD